MQTQRVFDIQYPTFVIVNRLHHDVLIGIAANPIITTQIRITRQVITRIADAANDFHLPSEGIIAVQSNIPLQSRSVLKQAVGTNDPSHPVILGLFNQIAIWADARHVGFSARIKRGIVADISASERDGRRIFGSAYRLDGTVESIIGDIGHCA